MPLRRCAQKRKSIRIPSLMQLALVFLLVIASALTGFAQTAQQFNIFKNYFVTGDYVVGGWVETGSSGGFATGTISIPDCKQAQAMGVVPCPPSPIPIGADIVAAYLYWGTVEGSQSLFAGQQAYFNGSKIIGSVLGDPNAPTSWSAGGCTGSSAGSKTMRIYRADVRPYLPLDLRTANGQPAYPTYGAILPNTTYTVQIADSGSNGNTQPNALGATLVIIWRDLSPSRPPLNAIVLYDGSYAPSNQVPTFMESIGGFYEPAAANLSAKITQIVANGQANKGENVYFASKQLFSLYGPPSYPAFPGIYGAWDNPTWDVTQYVKGGLVGSGFDTSETTSVSPTSTNSGCVNWGAVVFSTTVQDTDADGLLDVWENPTVGPKGYTDAVSGKFISLPDADSNKKDLFVQVDYLTLRDGDPKTGAVLHSHLPKAAALDAIASAFANNGVNGVNVHFDLPAGIYSGDANVISTDAPGKEIPESSLLCTDAAGALCQFPNQPAISWKGDFDFIKFANLQSGREQSYHYALFGHSLGEPRSYWAAANTAVASQFPTVPQLVSITKSGNTATVKIESPTLISSQGQLIQPQTPPLMLKPGDCNLKNIPAACITDANDANEGGMPAPPIWNRVTISGSLTTYPIPPFTQLNPGPDPIPAAPPLNGTYSILAGSLSTGKADPNGMVTTTFQIPVSNQNVPDGTYQFNCAGQASPPCIADPQLGVSYLGPTSTSGHGDFAGGDVAVTLGLWGADNAPGCVVDPSQLSPGQVSCDDKVGTLKVQTGTLMHELGHTLKLAHGGIYYPSTFNGTPYPSVPTYELNCKPNYLSVMSYLFQVRGFVDGDPNDPAPYNDPTQYRQFDYSGQWLPPLRETTCAVGANGCDADSATYYTQFGNTVNPLNESAGLGSDPFSQPAEHLTRWYSFPNAADSALADQAKAHCDGTPFLPNEPAEVRVDGILPPPPGTPFSPPLDWNNDLNPGDAIANVPAAANGVDLNHNGFFNDAPFSGFDDWASIDLQQMNGRAGLFGFSEGGLGAAGGGGLGAAGGGGLGAAGGGGIDSNGAGGLGAAGGGGLGAAGGGGLGAAGGGGLGAAGGGGLGAAGGGGEQDTENANSTVDAPRNLNCGQALTQNGVLYPACTGSSPSVEKAKGVPLNWTAPDFGQICSYTIWRAVGSFTTTSQIVAAFGSNQFHSVKTLSVPCSTTGPHTPPPTSTVDTNNLKSSTTYTYVIADSNKYGANSGASAPLIVLVKF